MIRRYVALLPEPEDGVCKVRHYLDSREIVVSVYSADGEEIPFTMSQLNASEVWITPGYFEIDPEGGAGRFVNFPSEGCKVVIVA